MEGDWLVALEQDSGRGRQGREWISQTGNFFGSTLVELRTTDPPAPSLSMAAGLALIEAVDLVAPGKQLMLKWPNDLLLCNGKLGGVLLERSGDRVVAGFGVNLATAPELPYRETASLGGAIRPEAFAPVMAGAFDRLLGLWRGTDASSFSMAWLARAHPVGTPLTVHSGPEQTSSGTFEGIEVDGALRLRTRGGGIAVVRAGDVEL